jgi:hypothetical protein
MMNCCPFLSGRTNGNKIEEESEEEGNERKKERDGYT